MRQRKLLDIANKLLERSKLGGVNWHISEVENTYVVTYSRSAFSISSDEVQPDYYRIAAINENAIEVDSLEFQDEDHPGYPLISELYDLAKGQARGVDDVLNTLLQEIEQQSTVDDSPF